MINCISKLKVTPNIILGKKIIDDTHYSLIGFLFHLYYSYFDNMFMFSDAYSNPFDDLVDVFIHDF